MSPAKEKAMYNPDDHHRLQVMTNRLVPLRYIRQGRCYIYAGHVYIRTDGEASGKGRIPAVRLTGGGRHSQDPDMQVEPVNVRLAVDRL